MAWDKISRHNRGFRKITVAHEAFGFEEIHADIPPFLPPKPGLVLDVGAGSGRDAAWIANHGGEMLAQLSAESKRQG